MIIALLCIQACIQDQSQTFLGFESRLRSIPSNLTSACFIFHGFPDTVAGINFAYTDKVGKIHEDYVLSLLESPKKYQVGLKNCLVYLASRVYTNKRGKTYLVLGKRDAWYLNLQLQEVSEDDFDWQDELMYQSVQSYINLNSVRERPLRFWSDTSDERTRLVRKNVESLLETIIITNQIDDNWVHPVPWR